MCYTEKSELLCSLNITIKLFANDMKLYVKVYQLSRRVCITIRYKNLYPAQCLSIGTFGLGGAGRCVTQSLVTHGRFIKQQQNTVFLNLTELTDGEMHMFRGIALHEHEDLLMCRLKILLVSGYLVKVGSGRSDKYLVN